LRHFQVRNSASRDVFAGTRRTGQWEAINRGLGAFLSGLKNQFNATIYGLDDRFRGVKGSRMVVPVNQADMRAQGLAEDDLITLQIIGDDGIDCQVCGSKANQLTCHRGDRIHGSAPGSMMLRNAGSSALSNTRLPFTAIRGPTCTRRQLGKLIF
jgi:hypothetical protein